VKMAMRGLDTGLKTRIDFDPVVAVLKRRSSAILIFAETHGDVADAFAALSGWNPILFSIG
jgi:hypothetical protein